MNIGDIIEVNGVMLKACRQETDGSGEHMKCNGCYFLKHKNLKCQDCAFTGERWWSDSHVIFKTSEDIKNDEESARMNATDGTPYQWLIGGI